MQGNDREAVLSYKLAITTCNFLIRDYMYSICLLKEDTHTCGCTVYKQLKLSANQLGNRVSLSLSSPLSLIPYKYIT